jgi:hypothetical protein
MSCTPDKTGHVEFDCLAGIPKVPKMTSLHHFKMFFFLPAVKPFFGGTLLHAFRYPFT